MFASQLSGHCDVIVNRLWCHQQNVKRASETRGWYAKILVFSVIYGFVMSRKKKKYCMYSCNERFMRSLECYLGVYFKHQLNTKITLSWAHKQFATRVHTLYYIYMASDWLTAQPPEAMLTRDRWIPIAKSHWSGKCFHLMTSSWVKGNQLSSWNDLVTNLVHTWKQFGQIGRCMIIHLTLIITPINAIWLVRKIWYCEKIYFLKITNISVIHIFYQ